MEKQNALFLFLLLAIIFLFSFTESEMQIPENALSAPPEFYRDLPQTPYLYSGDSSNPYSFNQGFCNNTGMDFIVQIEPSACSPAVVRSDLLEEQDVPVFCRLTGMKINPLIQVPYIKTVSASVENKSDVISAVTFIRENSRIGSYTSENNNFEGLPTMNNLGYLIVYLKQQPVESKIPENAVVNMRLKLNYDISRTYGIYGQEFILKELSQEEWLKDYTNYGFWRDKGYLRLEEVSNNGARISVYVNPKTFPIGTVELNEGEESKEVNLPGFYCGAGVKLKLEKISSDKNRAHIRYNDDEFVVEEDGKISNTECIVNNIIPKKYGGSITIWCPGQTPQTLPFTDLEAKIKVSGIDESGIKEKEIDVQPESEISANVSDKEQKIFYVAYIGKQITKENKFTDMIILFTKKEKQDEIDDKSVETVTRLIHEYIKANRNEALNVSEKPEPLLNEDINKLFISKKIKNYYYFYVLTKDKNPTFEGITFEIISVKGPRQVYYVKDVEDAYKEAIEHYKNTAFSYAKEMHPQGTYYGIIALYNAAKLANELHKEVDEADFYKEIINKYSDFEEPEIISDVEYARKKLMEMTSSTGDRTAVFSTSKGTYTFEVTSVEKPGYGVKEAYIEVDGVNGIYIVGDMIEEDYEIESITKNSVTMRNIGNESGRKTLTLGNSDYLNRKKAKLINTVVKEEVKVSVLPFDPGRETETNFTVKIGIEKRAIKLSPEQTKDAIKKLNSTISKLENARDNLGKVVEVWKKACIVGASALWIKNFATGLSGESLARKLVMKSWTDKCSDISYRRVLMNEKNIIQNDVISISRCYVERETEINTDVKVMKETLKSTNDFIDSVKATKGVMKKAGILGLSSVIDDEKFVEAAQKEMIKKIADKSILINETRRLGGLSQSERDNFGDIEVTLPDGAKKKIRDLNDLEKEKNKELLFKTGKSVGAEAVLGTMISLNEGGRLLRSDVKDIYFDIEIYDYCTKLSEADLKKSELCRQTILESYNKFNNYIVEYENHNAREEFKKDIGVSPVIIPGRLQTIKTPVYNVKNYDKLPAEISQQNQDKKFSYFFKDSGHYIAILEQIGDGKEFSIIKLYGIGRDTSDNVIALNNWENDALKTKLAELGISHVEEIDYSECNNNRIEKGPEFNDRRDIIKFWETGAYKGKIAYMPIEMNSGFYMATTSYTGLERAMVAWRENSDLNTFWICNVGKDKIPNFDFNAGPKGDDCCAQVSIVAGSVQIPYLNEADSQNLIKKTIECSREAIIAYSQGKNPINTKCGNFYLGKQPSAIPSVQCEDFMSPIDCRIMYNLCDPVMCPASRCNYGGKVPVDNVVQSGIIGSAMLCLPNYDDGKGVYMPVCLTGLHAGLDSFTGILKSSRDCLQEQLNTGRTIGICDQITSIYMCEFLWKQFDPFIRQGIPTIAESVSNKGGGEYAVFSESWKQSIDSARYFTDYYALNSFNAFKARSTSQIGTEVCKKFASVAYPNQANFFDELTKPESPTQATAWFDEISMGTASSDSHYKVFFYIFAGRDRGVYYNVYLKRPSGIGFYERTIPTEYPVKNGFGYLSTGGYVSLTPDFTAPSGYKEICIRLNEKEICGFGKASTSFFVNELQDSYLKDQLNNEITTNSECVSGSPSIIPTVTLNIQSAVQNNIEPAIYRRGIIRICSTQNPGKSTQFERWKYIGYCDNKNIGCWLDMNSVNESISDLGIRRDIINWSEERDIKNAIEKLGLEDPNITQTKLQDIDEEFVKLKNRIEEIIKGYRQNFEKNDSKELKKEYYHEIGKDYKEALKYGPQNTPIYLIDFYKDDFENISKFAIRSAEKSRAEIKIAELLGLKARLLALPDVIEFEEAEKRNQIGQTIQPKEECLGRWLISEDCNKLSGENLGKNFLNEQEGKICCITYSGRLKYKLEIVNKGVFPNVWFKWENERWYAISFDTIFDEARKIIGVPNWILSLDFNTYEDGLEKVWVNINKDSVNLKLYCIDSKNEFNKDVKNIQFSKDVKKEIFSWIKEKAEDCLIAEKKLELPKPVAIESYFTAWPISMENIPVENFPQITSCYGWRTLNNKKNFHDGIDVRASEGTKILAVADGIIERIFKDCVKGDSNCNAGFGNVVVIENSNNLYSAYSHLDSVSVNEKDVVKIGGVIGTTGCTGSCQANHLDFKVYTSKDDILKGDTGKHPLCFFSQNVIDTLTIGGLTAGIEGFKKSAINDAQKYKENVEKGYGAETSICMPSESYCKGVVGVITQEMLEKFKCFEFKNSEQCTEIKGKCWWNSNEKKCNECEKQTCDGIRKGFTGTFLTDWAVSDNPFKNPKDCEENNCNLACTWKESEGKCGNFDVDLFKENIAPEIKEISLSNLQAMSSNELNKLKQKSDALVFKINNTLKRLRNAEVSLDQADYKNIIQRREDLQRKIDSVLQKLQDAEAKNKEIEKIIKQRESSGEIIEERASASVFLISNINNQGFNNKNAPSVNFDDNVTICAVFNNSVIDYYSDYEVVKNAVIDSRTKEIKSFDNLISLNQISINWYNIAPLYAPVYEGAESRIIKNVYTLVAYNSRNSTHNDTIQYSQVPLDKTGWCITIDKEVGTYWFRAEVKIGDEIYSSLGKSADDSDFSGQNPFPDEYKNDKNTLLERNAYKYIDWGKRFYLGINEKVFRVSRKSDYSQTIYRSLGYAPNVGKLGRFMEIIESYKNVPFSYGCSSYCFDGKCYETISYNYIGIECLDLVIASLKQIRPNKQYSYTFNEFINESTSIILGKNNRKIEKKILGDIFNMNLGFATGGFSSFDKGHVNIGDILFVYTNATGYTNTLILYDDSNRNKILDGDDKAIHASSKCPENNQAYNGELCVTSLKKFNVEGNYFTIARLKDL